MSRSVSALGDYPDVYANWVASVKKASGIATALKVMVPQMVAGSRGGITQTMVPKIIPAAKYPAEVWVPLVNAHKWPLPDHYSRDGKWGYYLAPEGVSAIDLSKVKDSDIKDLPWTDALALSLKKIAAPAIIGAGAVYLATNLAGRALGSRK